MKLRWWMVLMAMMAATVAYGSGQCNACEQVSARTQACVTAPPYFVTGNMNCEIVDGAEYPCTYVRLKDPLPEGCDCTVTDPYEPPPFATCPSYCYESVNATCREQACQMSGALCQSMPGNEDEGPTSPIMRKYANGPWQLSDVVGGVPFDMAGDAVTRRWSWPESGIEMLAYDRSDASGFGPPDGKINSGAELFGDAPLHVGAARPANGFEKLKAFDENGDGWIDARDPIFAKLLFWRDEAPRDGVSQPHELATVASRGVEAISLDYHTTGRGDVNGNRFKYMSFAKIDGKTVPIYDVFLRSK